jgi:uncharacterized OB-fold protein
VVTQVSPAIPGTLQRPRFDAAAGALLGSRCSACGATAWPSRAVCHRCRSATEISTALARTGRLLTYTEVWVERPGLKPPYLIGQVRLDDGTLLFGHVRGLPGGARVPLPVTVVVGAERDTPPFWFDAGEPASRSEV